jgi:hypothetical protein
MTSRFLRLAMGLVRGWARIYTWGMPSVVAESRRAEIESDLWELQHDPDGARGLSLTVHVIGRLLIGVPDDLGWRVERAGDDDDDVVLRRIVAMMAASAVLLVAFWILPAWTGPSGPTGRTRVIECANEFTPPVSTPELRIQVITCAGAFFGPRAKMVSQPIGRDH